MCDDASCYGANYAEIHDGANDYGQVSAMHGGATSTHGVQAYREVPNTQADPG